MRLLAAAEDLYRRTVSPLQLCCSRLRVWIDLEADRVVGDVRGGRAHLHADAGVELSVIGDVGHQLI